MPRSPRTGRLGQVVEMNGHIALPIAHLHTVGLSPTARDAFEIQPHPPRVLITPSRPRAPQAPRVAHGFRCGGRGGGARSRSRAWPARWIGTSPPSIVMSAPVTLAVRSLARHRTRSATSAGRVNRPVAELCAACLTSSGLVPVARATVSGTPPAPSHRSVATGPGLTVLTLIPRALSVRGLVVRAAATTPAPPQ